MEITNAADMFPYRAEAYEFIRPCVENLTKEQLAFHPEGMRNSLGDVLGHMLTTEDFWIVEVAQGKPRLFEKRPTFQSGAEFVEQMDRMRAETERFLLSLTADELAAPFSGKTPWGGSLPSLRWVFHHVFEHEAYHAGQLAILLHLLGLEEPDM